MGAQGRACTLPVNGHEGATRDEPVDFREVALERLSTPEQLDQTVRITNSAGWLVLWGTLSLVAAGTA